jgi:fumarate reductase subunit C
MSNEIDLLKKIEDLTAEVNQSFGQKTKHVFARYPLTFALLIVFGVVMVTDGMKELLLQIPFLRNSPLVMILGGIVVLAITGTLYKKLNK